MRINLVLLLLLSAGSLFAVSNEDIRAIMDKTNASVEDAIFVIYSIDNPDAVLADLDSISNTRISALNKDSNLDAGSLALIAIELKKAGGGIIYNLSGLARYAAESLVYDGIYPAGFSWNREISGTELIELSTVIKNWK